MQAIEILRKQINKKHNPEDTFYSQNDCLLAMNEFNSELLTERDKLKEENEIIKEDFKILCQSTHKTLKEQSEFIIAKNEEIPFLKEINGNLIEGIENAQQIISTILSGKKIVNLDETIAHLNALVIKAKRQ